MGSKKSRAITGSFDTEDGTNTNLTVRTDVTILPFEVIDSDKTKKKFEHTKTVVRFETLKKNLTSGNECYREVRYFITSLPADLDENPDVAEDFVKLKLRRWAVKVSHFHIDGNLRQDRIVFRDEKSAFFSGSINKIVMKDLLPYVEEQKFFSRQGTDFSVGDSLVHTGRCAGIAASLLADSIGMDMHLQG